MGPDLLSLALHRTSFLKTREKTFLREVLTGESEFIKLSLKDLSGLLCRNFRLPSWDPKATVKEAEEDAAVLSDGSIRCLSVLDADYPPQLLELYNPPYLLFYRGSLPDYSIPSLAIVGTRYATTAGLDASFDLAFQASDAGIPVVSGLAIGIDTAAHQGSLHAGGYTLAVLGCGCDRLYPASSSRVACGILSSGGCVISEYPPGTPPLAFHFPERNRIISGLCRGTVVIQAPERSGALITADFALEQGRDLFVFTGLLDSAGNTGCRNLSEAGAPGVNGISDILDEWDITVRRRKADSPEGSVKNAGVRMARLLDDEIRGRIIRYKGNTYRRVYQHG